ncbi:hypothetical protein Unana1_00444 [Umbelopsis nana]
MAGSRYKKDLPWSQEELANSWNASDAMNVSLASLQIGSQNSSPKGSGSPQSSSPRVTQSPRRPAAPPARKWDFTNNEQNLNVTDWKSPVGITLSHGREEIFRATQNSPKPADNEVTYGGEWVDHNWQHPTPGKKFKDRFVHYTTPHDTRSFKLQNATDDRPYFVEVDTDYEAFRDHPIIPTKKELLNIPPNLIRTNTLPTRARGKDPEYGQIPGVPVMKVFGPYDSADQYLHTQFELMRYDCLIPMQMAIASYKMICNPPEQPEPADAANFSQVQESLHRNFHVYENVKIDAVVFGFHHVVYRVSFRLPYGVSVNWEASKRLIPGSLVMLSKDGFENDLKIACVTHREEKPMRGRNRFEYLLDLFVETDNEADPLGFGDPDGNETPHVMLEATSGYFEAYRHVMSVLQDVSSTNLPFAPQIIHMDSKIGIPRYAQMKRFYDLSLTPTKRGEPPRYPADITKLFPPYSEMGLDETQYRALHRILSKKLAIVQGPPGTGKTHVGLYATHILLKNYENDNSLGPIVCICQTNHAIDQFLEHILKYEKNIVRVGGRSKSEAVQNFTLYEMRKTEKEMGLSHIFRKRSELQKKLNDLIYEMYEEPCVSFHYIKKAGILSPRQLDSLKSLAEKPSANKGGRAAADFEDEWVINSEPPLNLCGGRGSANDCAGGNINHEKAAAPERPPHPVEIWLGSAIETVNPMQSMPGYDELDPSKGDILDQIKGKEFEKDEEEEEAMDEEEVQEKIQNFREENSSGSKKDPFIGLNLSYWFQPASPPKGSGPPTSNGSSTIAERRTINYDRQDDSVGEKRRTQWQLSNDWNVWCRNTTDVSSWPMAVRLAAHKDWVKMRNMETIKTIRSIMKQYTSLSRDFKKIRTATDAKICKRNRVIGMTSTAAAKYHDLLEAIKPRVIILEEAGEMLESHIVSAIPTSAQHVILIGDQQQLRPNPSVYALGEYHNFNVSLFERLIVNDIPFSRLSHQRRMAPQIRSLVDPIYRNPPLMDHPHVLTYPSIPGMQQNLFFLIHNEPESHVSESASKYNDHEAQMAALLASYLIMQGIPPDMITILTMYSGQRRKLREYLRKERRMGDDINLVNISSVDGFQGEESEVVILSLVRSNSMGAIGFLKVANRVCVALSRAKQGMYILGNGAMLCRRSELWNEIIGNLEDQHPDCIGEHLQLRCQQHPDRITSIQYPIDFKGVEEGGCGQPCEIILPCGHKIATMEL